MHEKRLHPRKPVSILVTIIFEATGARAEGTCRDISIGGMFVETDTQAAFGDRLTVQIQDKTGPLNFPAIVRWTAPTGIGLQFGLYGARETHAIAQLMSSRH